MKIELTIAYVGFGGNTGEGQYFFSYSPNTAIVKTANTELDFVFSDATTDNFKMFEMVTCDVSNQFSKAIKSSDQRSMKVINSNTKPQLTIVSILVEDSARKNKIVSCDPQVLNVPD